MEYIEYMYSIKCPVNRGDLNSMSASHMVKTGKNRFIVVGHLVY